MNIINDEDIPRATLEELQEINANLKLIAQQLSGIKMKVGLTAPKQPWENNTADQLKRIADFMLNGSRDGMTIFDPQEGHIKDLQQATLEMQLQQMREELERSKSKNIPKYHIKEHLLVVQNETIDIAPDSNHHYLCMTLLKNRKAMQTEWQNAELSSEWDAERTDPNPRIPYRAALDVNKKVAAKTDIKRLFITNTKTTRVNPDLLN